MLSKRGAMSSRVLPSVANQDESMTTLLEPATDSAGSRDNLSLVENGRGCFTLETTPDLIRHQMRCGLSSPTPSCEGDVSSLNAEDDDDDDDGTILSRNTSDTIIPRDTDITTTTTDFTTDHTPSEADELDRKFHLRKYYS